MTKKDKKKIIKWLRDLRLYKTCLSKDSYKEIGDLIKTVKNDMDHD